jgi:hypothetical protein
MTQQELEDLLKEQDLMGKAVSVSTSNRKYSGTAMAVENGTLHLEGDPLYRSVRIAISHIEAIF